ncbi:thymidine phosphorylase-like isoform X1 [Homalodisca vitripennis]|uniref:thymidine phosphorylase-like isoform X1 n=2 Tax=Homalodisca vitripennis TaxID=197043 RepID=UPI001EEBDEF4|nr:thymidine phosphorylase-like isoform X1 [Homalodisca vitripennis]
MANFSLKMNVGQLLRKKRDGEEMTKDEIESFIQNTVSGNNTESQIGAMLMAMYIRGITDTEATNLTQSILLSGERLQWRPEWESKLVEKHSTGGVGDKISLILTPILAACGLKVPMISGRSLEHTGGTLDKLESIPGFRVDIDYKTMEEALEQAGCFIAAANAQLCPADRILYGVRDITCTVDCVGLIVSSIISKKVASGAKFLVMDVKVGKAAFCKTVEKARALAKQLISVSAQLGVRSRVVLSRMDEPLGITAGNALEVAEAVKSLAGNMSSDVARLVTVLGANLLEMTGYAGNGEDLIRQVIKDGSAMERFRRMLVQQGVEDSVANRLVQGQPVLPTALYTTQLRAQSSGWVEEVNAWIIGQVCLELGAGRRKTGDTIDLTVGVEVWKHQGDRVVEGEPWVTVHHSTPSLPTPLVSYLQQALEVEPALLDRPDIIIEILH